MERSRQIGLYGLLLGAALWSIHHLATSADLVSAKNVPEGEVADSDHLVPATHPPRASESISLATGGKPSANTVDPKGLPDAKQDATVMESTGPDTDQLTSIEGYINQGYLSAQDIERLQQILERMDGQTHLEALRKLNTAINSDQIILPPGEVLL